MTLTHLLYLHGFRSSPLSYKAQAMARYMAERHPDVHFWCPQLPPSPREAMALVEAGIADWPRATMGVIGSSLGGFYATWVAHQTGCPSVLVNPAVHPERDLARHLGEQTTWQDPSARFFFRAEFLDELRALGLHDQPPAGPELLLVAKGDEVLDWREMTARYLQATQIVREGGDHAFSEFEDYLDRIAAFLGAAQGPTGR